MPAETQEGKTETRSRNILEIVDRVLARLEEAAVRLSREAQEAVKGERLGRDVAAFYHSLVDSGVPEDLARELTHLYLEKRLEKTPTVADVAQAVLGKSGQSIHVLQLPAGSLERLQEALSKVREATEQDNG